MPFDCQHRLKFGHDACLRDCPALAPWGRFSYLRVEDAGERPPREDRAVDVVLLDMHHGWPNLGHDALVHAIQNIVCDLVPVLERADLQVRAISYDVRRRHLIPDPPGPGARIYLGTGGPGHIDPAQNDGRSPGSQGIAEDPGWEPPLRELFDRIREDEEAALLAVCHTFGVMCRWLEVAVPTLRPPSKGGKSAGIAENVLTPEALRHPWFSRFAAELPEHRRLRILDSRLYDLIPSGDPASRGILPIGYEALGIGGAVGDALTMMEVERDPTGRVPRIFGVNHHPEIVNRQRVMTVLRQKRARGEVSAEWYAERARALTETIPDEDCDQRLHLTSRYTLFAPLRYFLNRQIRLAAQRLDVPVDIHEDDLLPAPAGVGVTHRGDSR